MLTRSLLWIFLGFVVTRAALVSVPAAADGQAEELLSQAKSAYERGEKEQAFSLAQKAIEADPKSPQGYYFRARLHDALKQYEKALADYGAVLDRNRSAKEVHQARGVVHFKLGHIQQAIADFDRLIQLDSSRAPYHWQRGIAYYYAGRYAEGRKQFELHQTVNPNDVENAVWHFLCVARGESVKKARESFIPIERDSRVPMKQVHALFAGRGTTADVLAAAQAGAPPAEELKDRLFYAHLYIGLYQEALGDNRAAKEHLLKAAQDYAADHYMGDVARVHVKLRTESWTKE